MDELKHQRSNNSTWIEDMKIIAHNKDGFLLYPTKRRVAEIKEIQAIHSHVYYEFFFATDVPLCIVTEKETRQFQNSVVIVPPKLKHFSCCEGEGGYCIAVTAKDVKTIGEVGLLDYVKKDKLTVLPINEQVAYCLKKLTTEDVFSRFGKARSEAYLKLLFLEIATLLFVKDDVITGETVDQKYQYIEKIDRFIGENYNKKEATVANLATELCLSVRQTSRVVKSEYGCSFVELVNEKRMSVAALLLEKSDLSVGDILKELNFETENYFYKTFKKRYGVTPLKYRKQTR